MCRILLDRTPEQMEVVKDLYEQRYGQPLEEAIVRSRRVPLFVARTLNAADQSRVTLSLR